MVPDPPALNSKDPVIPNACASAQPVLSIAPEQLAAFSYSPIFERFHVPKRLELLVFSFSSSQENKNRANERIKIRFIDFP